MALSCDTVAPQLRGCGFLHANIMRIDVQVKSVHDSDIYALRYRVGDQEVLPQHFRQCMRSYHERRAPWRLPQLAGPARLTSRASVTSSRGTPIKLVQVTLLAATARNRAIRSGVLRIASVRNAE